MIKKLFREIRKNQELRLIKKQARLHSEEEKEVDYDHFEEKVHANSGLIQQATFEPGKISKNRGQNNEILSKFKQKDR